MSGVGQGTQPCSRPCPCVAGSLLTSCQAGQRRPRAALPVMLCGRVKSKDRRPHRRAQGGATGPSGDERSEGRVLTRELPRPRSGRGQGSLGALRGLGGHRGQGRGGAVSGKWARASKAGREDFYRETNS